MSAQVGASAATSELTQSGLAPARIELGGLSDSIGFLSRMAQLQIYKRFFDRFGAHDLRPGGFTVLHLIGLNPGIRQGLISQCLIIKPAHMSKLVASFERRGLLMRHIPPDDRRSVELRLTEVGVQFVQSHLADFFALEAAHMAQLTGPEQQEFKRLLRKFTGFNER